MSDVKEIIKKMIITLMNLISKDILYHEYKDRKEQ